MKVRKIIMVEPKSPRKHVYSFVRLPRLGLPILGTIASRRGIDVSVVIEEMAPVDLAQVASADLLCISTITSTAPRAYRLADQARAAGVPVIIGGAHPTFLPEDALAHADWVMRGEAEVSLGLFLDMLEGKITPAEVPGLSYRCDDRVVHNEMSAPVDLDQVPIPDFSLLAGQKKKMYFDRGIIPIQTSRGCPHQCSFCTVTPMFGRRMRFASHEHVAEELMRRRGQGKVVFFYDDNFCGSPERAKSLLDYLLTKNIFLPIWLAQVSVRAAKDLEMLKLMQRARCHTVFVGFESIEPGSLTLLHKNQTVNDIRTAIQRFHQHGIWVHGMFINGSDAEGVETIRATSRFAIEEDIDSIQFAVLTPLPGSVFFEEAARDGRLLNHDWALYDGHHAVFQPAKMSAEVLTTETMAAMGRVYATKRILGQFARGKIERGLCSWYAHRQVKRWQKEDRRMHQTAQEPSPPACTRNLSMNPS